MSGTGGSTVGTSTYTAEVSGAPSLIELRQAAQSKDLVERRSGTARMLTAQKGALPGAYWVFKLQEVLENAGRATWSNQIEGEALPGTEIQSVERSREGRGSWEMHGGEIASALSRLENSGLGLVTLVGRSCPFMHSRLTRIDTRMRYDGCTRR